MNTVRTGYKRRRQRSELGSSIIQGLNEAIAWAAGDNDDVDVRVTTIQVPQVDVRKVRERMGLSQAAFALKFGFKPASVRNCEQHRREPELPARILLAVIDKRPDVVQAVLAGEA